MSRFDEIENIRRDVQGRFAPYSGEDQPGSLTDDRAIDEQDTETPESHSSSFEDELAREQELFGGNILSHDPGWTWTSLAAQAGHERAAELYRESGGSIGKAIAMHEPRRRASDLNRIRSETPHPLGGPQPTWDVDHEPRPVTELTAREGSTLRRLPTSRLAAVSRRLHEGPADGFVETGPESRMEIVRQIGDRPFGNLHAISGGRVIPLPDGVELPVSHGYSVRVRLAAGDTYTVQRVFTRTGQDTVKGERTDVHDTDVGQAAYYASSYASHSAQEWITA